MIPASVIASVAKLGLSVEQVEQVALLLRQVEDATKVECEVAIKARRANDRERKERQKASRVALPDHVNSREVTGTHVNSGNSASRVGVMRAEIPTTLSSVPIQETTSTSVSAKPRRVRCVMPDDFVPKPSTFEKARTRWSYTDADVRNRVEALGEWSRGKGEKRDDWDAVVLGALRRDFEERKKTGPPGRPTNGGGKTFSEMYRESVALREQLEQSPPAPNVIDIKALSH